MRAVRSGGNPCHEILSDAQTEENMLILPGIADQKRIARKLHLVMTGHMRMYENLDVRFALAGRVDDADINCMR